ncbi:MAG: metallophosphoesterase [SAR324 cluster bacterium]|nr:metallophosphoesterase [SAR324 cluster bacterium]
MMTVWWFVCFAAGIGFVLLVRQTMIHKACFRQKITLNKPAEPSLKTSEEVRILVLGDTGSALPEQHQVARASARTCEDLGCDMVLLLGDNFIQQGVSGIDDPQFKNKFEEIYPQQLPFYAVLGNHDIRGNWRAQIEYTNHSSRWFMPDVNYSFEAGPVLFQAINTTCTICSLWSLFRKSNKDWRVVFGHRPMLTTGRHPGMTWLERWLIRRSGAKLVLSGHNPGLEHLEDHGLHQIVSGGGGTPLPPLQERDSPAKKFSAHTLGYVWLHLTTGSVKARYFNADGKFLYSFEDHKK